MKSALHYCFTLNNYNSLELAELRENEFKYSYCVFGFEVAPNTGTPHLQGYMQFPKRKRFDVLKKINPRMHWSICKGTDEDNYNYCTKDKKFEEYGERLPCGWQGKRTDLIELAETIKSGKKVDDIIIENPEGFQKYGRTLTKLEDIMLRKKFRTWMTKCEWLYGKTGVGKSHIAFEGFNPDTHYLWKLNDKGWQDGYTGQETVIINDFRGEIPYNELLNLIDKWPYTLARRGREPVPFLAKKIIITSSLEPEQVYWRRVEEDSIEQLKRRCIIREITEKQCILS